MSIYAFMGENPVLTFSCAWLILHTVFRVINRCLRTINIATRGWPPVPLDADGDVIKPEGD